MRAYLAIFSMIFVFLFVGVSITSAIVIQDYFSVISEELENRRLEVSFDELPEEEDNIIHSVNVTAWYRPTRYQSGKGCTQSHANTNITLYSRSDYESLWNYVTSTKNFEYSFFENEITEKINKNNYDFKYEIFPDYPNSIDDYCIYLKNMTLLVSYTVKGSIDIGHDYNETIQIERGKSYDLEITLNCNPRTAGTTSYEYFCGQMKYDLRSQYGLISAEPIWSTNNLGYGEETSETITMPIYAESVGFDYLYINATGYYNSQKLSNMYAETTSIGVEVIEGPGAPDPAGEIVAIGPDFNLQSPIPQWDDVEFKVNVSCDSGYCGNVNGTIATGMIVKETPTIDCNNLDSGESCEFIWILGYNTEYSPPYNILATFTSDESGVEMEEIEDIISYSTTPSTTAQNVIGIVIEHPKNTSFYVGEDFYLQALVTCNEPTSVDCGGTKIYAFFDDYGTDVIIEETSKIYMTDPYQTNPVDYSIQPIKRWDIRSDTPGTYRLGVYSVNPDNPYNSVRMPAVIVINERPLTDNDISDNETDENNTIVPDIVDESIYSIDIIEPAPSTTFKRGDEVSIKVKAIKDDAICMDCTLYASSSFFDNNFNLGFENGFYTGTGEIRDDAKGVGDLAILLNTKTSESVNLLVDPTIAVTASTDKESYDVYDVIKISGVSPKRAYVDIELVCDEYKKDLATKQANSMGRFEFEIPISLAVPGGACLVKVNVKDMYSNTGETDIDIMIKGSEMRTYNLVFASPQKDSKITKGDVIDISVRVTRSSQGIDDMNVYCNGLSGDIINLTHESDGIYKTSYKVSIHYKKTDWVFSCIAEKGNEFGSNSMILSLIDPKINLEIIEPDPYEPLSSGEVVKIKVRALYNDETPVNEARIVMKINGDNEAILKQSDDGTYVGNFDTGENELVSMDFSASDGHGVTGVMDRVRFDVKTSDFADYLLYMAIAIVIVAVALVSVVVFGKREKGQTTIITKTEKIDMAEVEEKIKEKHKMDRELNLKEKLRDLQMEYDNINNDIDMIHKEYYKRELDEDTFVKLLQERKERKQDIISTMNNVMRELKSIQSQNSGQENGRYD